MIRRVASEYDYLFYSDMEIRRGGVTHTIDTIRELKKVDPDRKIYFIIGGDSLKWVDNWIEADELFDNVTYIAYARDDDNLDNAANEIKRIKNGHSNADIYLMDSFVAPISSTKIRENINSGISIKNMLPDYLEEYILQNRLYKESKYGTKKARIAGLLHDCAKCIPTEEKLIKAEKFGLPVNSSERANPDLLHGKLGAYYARTKYGINDKEILDAITYHTTGRPGMTLMDKIIYVADYIEPNRRMLNELPEIRKEAFQDIDKALLHILKNILVYLESQSCEIDEMTEKTYYYYCSNNKK